MFSGVAETTLDVLSGVRKNSMERFVRGFKSLSGVSKNDMECLSLDILSSSPIAYIDAIRNAFFSLNMVLVLANSVDTNEMLHHAVLHLGLHLLSRYSFTSYQYSNG